MSKAIWWIRRDLRLSDNQALKSALDNVDEVIPVFILDQSLWSSPYVGDKRLSFLLGGLHQLSLELKRKGSYLVIRQGDPIAELHKLLAETGAEHIYAEQDFSPYARRRDSTAKKQLPISYLAGITVHHPQKILKADNNPYTIFTPYSKAWKKLALPEPYQVLPSPEQIKTPGGISGVRLQDPSVDLSTLAFYPGSTPAQERLKIFVDGENPLIYEYGNLRNRPDLHSTSGLSPYLRFGMVSARQACITALSAIESAPNERSAKSAETWLNELIWREFFYYILYHYPSVRQESFKADLRNIRWINDPEDFEAWCQGKTGYPIIDAAMRQLSNTGWMHNRTRMLVASFLTKDLLIDWRWGEKWFMQHLIDGDPASNNGGWQWAAGTGTDAAPYFRVFNPTIQSKKYDPQGTYIRRWVEELRNVPTEFIHQPWTMPPEIQSESGCLISVDYPAPMVDHKWARERALQFYRQSKT